MLSGINMTVDKQFLTGLERFDCIHEFGSCETRLDVGYVFIK